MLRQTPRYEALIIRVSLTLLLCISVIAALAIVFVTQHGRQLDAILRLAIPATVIVSSLAAFALVQRGRARTGVGLVLGASYVSIMVYVIAGGYGLHSYLFAIFSLIIIVASLLIGRGAGVVATLVALATVLTLFALQRNGYVTDVAAVRAIPLPNILTVYCILFAAVGSVQYVYSRVFQDMLLAAGEQETRLRQVMDAAPLGQVVHRDGRVLMINSVAARMAGGAPEALAGAAVRGFIDPEQHAAFDAHMAAARTSAAGHSSAAEFRITDAKGRARLFDTLTTPVDFVDGPALLTVLRDATEERAAAAALAAAKSEAESASRAKSQFLANMSHEIRTPMNAVLGLSEMLAASGLHGTQLNYARTIHQSAGSLLALINDVLDVSRIEEGYLDLDRRPFALAALFDSLRSTLQPLADAKQLIFEITVDAALPSVLSGDASRLRQIALNLAGNAIKFTEHGRVGIEVLAAAHDMPAGATGAAAVEDRSSVRLVIRVTDTGSGIAPEQQERLFERFVQADGSDTRRHGGSGLGLFIVRELAQRMGGNVTVQSVPGLGSRFEALVILALPTPEQHAQHAGQAQANEAGAPPSPSLPANTADITAAVTAAVTGTGGAMTILLVEDNEINRMVARGMLATAGHRVVEAADGVQALACHAAQQFDCILMDIQMPVMGGIEATRAIRAREQAQAGNPVPIVALTANAMQGDRERFLAAGMNDFLAKPYERANLLLALERAAQPVARHAAPPVTGVPGTRLPDHAMSPASAASFDAIAVFDAQALDGLIRLDQTSPGLLAKLVVHFVPDAHSLIAELTAPTTPELTDGEAGTAAASEADQSIARAAHSLNSTCARFGALRAAALARSVEQAVGAGHLDEARRRGAQVRAAFDAFEKLFRQHPAIAALHL